MAQPVPAPSGNGSAHWSLARICDCWLGGSNFTDTDRELAEHVVVCAPHLPYLVRIQRAFLERLVRYLSGQGVRQFLDLGSGVPTVGHVHEIAQGLAPESRVVYVDVDPDVAAEGAELLADNDNAAYLQADIRNADRVLESPELGKLLDFNEPVALLAVETLLNIPDADDPLAVVTAFTERMCSGSYLAISHFTDGDEQLETGLNLFSRMFGAPPAVTLRGLPQITHFFSGFELVEPGVVPMPLWRPVPGDEVDHNPEQVPVLAGLARKP